MQTYHQKPMPNPLLFSSNVADARIRIRASAKPRIRLLPADWADAYFKIPPRSAKSGNWNTAEVEYTRAILNSVVNPNISNIYVMTSRSSV